MSAWPAAVWRSPWLRGLDGTSRAALEAAGTVRWFERGTAVFEPGQHGDSFFVVGEGLVELRGVRRGDAEVSLIRRVVASESVGEESVVRPGAARAATAACVTTACIVEVPVSVFRRLAGRGEAAEVARQERDLRETAVRDALGASSLARTLDAGELAGLVPLVEAREVSRGDVLFAQGDPVQRAFVLADGMVVIETEDDGKARIRAYLGRGDLVVDGAFEAGGAHEVTARACGEAWVLAIPRDVLLRAAQGKLDALRTAHRLSSSAPLPQATRHVMGDLWRFAVAGSMLVIDDEACVRCGHCAWSCAETHDGVSRLVRRGEKVTVRDATDGSARALVLPGGCHQCKHPACMVDCPTGAIGRDPRGQVFIREELCVGCGQCARACPWGSVQMIPRADAVPGVAAAQIAVKCDACRGDPRGPVCVRACPVEAIARVNPQAAMVEVRRAPGGESTPARTALPRARPAWPWVTGASLAVAALATLRPSSWRAHLISGFALGLVCVVLVGYSLSKRFCVRRFSTRPQMIAHLALGVLAIGGVMAHTGGRFPPGVSGALLLSFLLSSATGALAGLAYRVLPPALARIERQGRLPEDLPRLALELAERTFGALSGRSDATKAVYARVLAPYGSAWLGSLRLLASRRTLQEEERHLGQRVARLGGSAGVRLDGLDDLVRLVVERRSLAAQRLLQALLRLWVPLHIVSVAVTVALLLAHVAIVAGFP